MLSSLMSNNKKTLKYLYQSYGERLVTSLVHLCNFLVAEKNQNHQTVSSISFLLYFVLQLQCEHRQFRRLFFVRRWLKTLETLTAIAAADTDEIKKQVVECIRLMSFDLSPLLILGYNWKGLIHLPSFRGLVLFMCQQQCYKGRIVEFICNNRLLEHLTPYLISVKRTRVKESTSDSRKSDIQLKELITNHFTSKNSNSVEGIAIMWLLSANTTTPSQQWYKHVGNLITFIMSQGGSDWKTYVLLFIHQELKKLSESTGPCPDSIICRYTATYETDNWWQTLSLRALAAKLLMFSNIDKASKLI